LDCDQYKVDDDYAEYNAYRRMADHAKQMERERDEAREQWRLSSVCRELTEQRDRLAEALEDLLNDGFDHKLAKIRAAQEALATLKEQSND